MVSFFVVLVCLVDSCGKEIGKWLIKWISLCRYWGCKKCCKCWWFSYWVERVVVIGFGLEMVVDCGISGYFVLYWGIFDLYYGLWVCGNYCGVYGVSCIVVEFVLFV